MDMFKGISTSIGGSGGDGAGILGELNESLTLSRKNRIFGFAICFSLGWGLSFIAPAFLFSSSTFAVLYTAGNSLTLISMMFLMGPVKQIKQMFHSSRWIATSVYILCLGLTLWAGITKQSIVLIVFLLIAQFAAMCWYTLSYVPYARNFIRGLVCSCIRTSE